MKDFFISYAGADRPWAEWIAWELETAGYTTTLQAWDFRPGANFVLEMDTAKREGRRTIAVLSDRYLSALYTRTEWAGAFRQDPTGEQRRLVPVRIDDCALDGHLAEIVFIDLVGLSPEDARNSLLAGVSEGRGKPSVAPRFPGAPARSGTRPIFPPLAELFPDASPEKLEALERDASLVRDDKLFFGAMWELNALDRAREDAMSEIVAMDNENARLAKERDRVARTMSDPDSKRQYAELEARSRELGEQRNVLWGRMKALGQKRDAKSGALRRRQAEQLRQMGKIFFKTPGDGS